MSQPTPRPLALTFPLRGSQLIEASAGTGKTFTISALYLRLVLGHGGEQSGFGREVLPPQILVVTFTDAATKELRDRIRARLAQAAQFFRAEIDTPDPLLEQLRDDYPDDAWPLCASKLDAAAQWMDEAAVSTIHGWCQRMLREHALDSGSLFTQTLETDHSELLNEVMRDYWRQFCYAMAGETLSWVREQWKSPATLLGRVKPMLGSAGELDEKADPARHIEGGLGQRRQALETIKAPWGEWVEQLRALLQQAVAAKTVDARKLQPRFFEPWLESLAQWQATPENTLLDIGKGFERLTPQGLAEAWKGEPPSHPALDDMLTLRERLQQLPDPGADALAHAAAWVAARFESEKRRRAEMGFDDMLLRLDAALRGDAGEALAQVIREQFPVALIDEFQDTDPVQYRIFERIYQIEQNRKDLGIFLIGDPKQAIYAFRGADIHTYLRARRASTGRLHSLGTNFRSTKPMVAAVNQVFEHAERRATGQGAFLFRDGDDNPVPFLPVAAQGRKDALAVRGQPQAALTFWQLPSEKPLAKGTYRDQLAPACASEIVRLLQLAKLGQCGFVQADGTQRPLAPADIAILVRDGGEARAIRMQLRLRGVRSVYLSDKESVFRSQEAVDVLAWLRACAEPDADRLLRAALASVTLARPLAELDALNRDELAWERRVMQFRDYRALWRSQGVLSMLRRLLHDFQLPVRLTARGDGERVLTNLLHLTELLQQASSELDGEQALVRYLSERLTSEVDGGEEQVVRLESDEQLVKVVTIHKSKGLEYPLVFLPFVCNTRPVDGSRLPVAWHDQDGELRLTMTPDEAVIAAADDERLGEDLRLLYVALTRAQYACWLGVADLKRGRESRSLLHRSALGYLLGGGVPLDDSTGLAGWLNDMAQGCPALTVQGLPEVDEQLYVPVRSEQHLQPAREPGRRAAEHWWIASYSALRIADSISGDWAPDSLLAQNLLDDEPLAHADEFYPEQGSIHQFPRGPHPGTFLHSLLEWAAREGFAALTEQPEALRDGVARRCATRGWEGWIPTLEAWLSHLLTVPMPAGEGTEVRLCELGDYRFEMEFWFASREVDVLRLDTLVRQHTYHGAPRAAAESGRLNGLFKGFIDLCFEHEGRYYVADYKSNWLGAENASYSPAAMESAMLEHRYDLQCVLYLLALHRQLKARLPDYDYDRHIGGALFIFLRGLSARSRGVHFSRPPRALIEELDLLFQGKLHTLATAAQTDLFGEAYP
ncbi:exodeoxyribonuclease V subunit beta [Pseudomonas cremoricolorata]|uniref:exodeoxyribonuclease V subunit beta n=1 Tax=Pseudomonas cremoricolorata TaxID=157783 RepID=UPI000415AD63|nr:exodeoxyribonuclease V subunit beta [Pseudomonas cremoricolorata]